MKKVVRVLFFTISITAISLATSCDDLEEQACTGCTDDAPWGTLGGSDCYASQSACEDAESGNCVICQ